MFRRDRGSFLDVPIFAMEIGRGTLFISHDSLLYAFHCRGSHDSSTVHSSSDSNRARGKYCRKESMATVADRLRNGRELCRIHISPPRFARSVCGACGLHPSYDLLYSASLWVWLFDTPSVSAIHRCAYGRALLPLQGMGCRNHCSDLWDRCS